MEALSLDVEGAPRAGFLLEEILLLRGKFGQSFVRLECLLRGKEALSCALHDSTFRYVVQLWGRGVELANCGGDVLCSLRVC